MKAKSKESVRCKIIAGKNETIADLEEQVNQKNWQIEKLQDDLSVSHRHYENIKQELQATHEHYENMYAELVSGGKRLLRKEISKYVPKDIIGYKVLIENKSYKDLIQLEDLIQLYDAKDNFFYCDLPFFEGIAYDNSKPFSHEKLRDILANIKGRFILRYDESPLIRKLYKNFHMLSVLRSKEGKSDYKLIIANFPLYPKA